MEDRELPLTPLTVCQNPVCALEKRVLENMVQTKRIECRGSCAMELKQLKEEMAQLKRDMHDLVAKKREKDQLIVISPSYSVRSMNVDKEGAYKTLVDKTRIMEEQLMDVIRSLEETDTPDRNRLAPSEVGKKKQNQLTECPSSVRKERNVQQMQESEPCEGQLRTHEQQHAAETPRVAFDEFPVAVMENENRKGGLVLEVTEQENQEQLQSSKIQKQKHIEVVSDTVELAPDCGTEKEQALEHIELLNSEKPQGEDLQVEQLEHVEIPNSGKSMQRDIQVEQPLSGVELLNSYNSMQQGRGLVLQVTEQENQEQLQSSKIQKQKHIEVVSDTVELARDCGTEKEQALEHIELLNSEKPPGEDLQVEQLEHVEIPNSGKSMQPDIQVEQPLSGVELLNSYNSMQQDLEMEQPFDGMELYLEREQSLDGAEFPNSDKSTQQDLQIEQLEFVELPNPEKSPLQDLHMEDIVSNPICVPMNMECSVDFQHLGPYNSELSLDHIESTIEIEMTPTDIPKDSEIDPQEQANQLTGETEAHPYQPGEQQSDDRIQRQLVEVETPRPELPCPGQLEEVRIAKMVEPGEQQSDDRIQRQLVEVETPRPELPCPGQPEEVRIAKMVEPGEQQSDDRIQRQLVEVETPRPELPCLGQPEEVRIAKMVEPGEQQSDDRIQRQLVEVETTRPELPCPGQPEEVRIAKMVEELVLQQQQQLNARSGSELIPFHPTDLTATSQKSSRPQRKRRPPPITYPYTEHRSPKQPRAKKAASIGTPDSDGALDVIPLNVQYYSEEPSSERRSPKKQSKRKLNYSSTPPKQKGRPRSSSKPKKKKQQPKRQKPDSDMTVKTPSDDQLQDEGEPSQRSTASLMSGNEHQESTPAPEMPENEMPDTEAAVEIPSPSDDQQQGSKKAARLNASVVKEWLARQGLLDGRKRPAKV